MTIPNLPTPRKPQGEADNDPAALLSLLRDPTSAHRVHSNGVVLALFQQRPWATSGVFLSMGAAIGMPVAFVVTLPANATHALLLAALVASALPLAACSYTYALILAEGGHSPRSRSHRERALRRSLPLWTVTLLVCVALFFVPAAIGELWPFVAGLMLVGTATLSLIWSPALLVEDSPPWSTLVSGVDCIFYQPATAKGGRNSDLAGYGTVRRWTLAYLVLGGGPFWLLRDRPEVILVVIAVMAFSTLLAGGAQTVRHLAMLTVRRGAWPLADRARLERAPLSPQTTDELA